jgi:hypothetical protein
MPYRISVLLLCAAPLLLFPSATSTTSLSEAEIRQRVEADYPGKVLRIEHTDFGGRQVLAVKFMISQMENGAIGVTTLLVDAETGRLLVVDRRGVPVPIGERGAKLRAGGSGLRPLLCRH